MTSETFTPSLQDVKVTLAPKAPRNRIWEIDFLRGACVVLMILDHLVMMIAQFFGPAWFGVDMAGDGGAAFCRWCAWFHESWCWALGAGGIRIRMSWPGESGGYSKKKIWIWPG